VLSEGATAGAKLVHVEAATNAVTGAFRAATGGPATWLAAAGGNAWLVDDSGGVSRLAPRASAAEQVALAGPDGPPGMASWPVAAVGSIWVSWLPAERCCVPPFSSDLLRVDAATETVIARIEGASRVVASGPGFVWALGNDPDPANGDALLRIDTRTNATVSIGERGFTWVDSTFMGGAVWASSAVDSSIVRLDPMTGAEYERIRMDGAPGALAAGAGAVWAAIGGNSAVARYDIETGRIETIDVGGTPDDLVFANGSIWVTVFGEPPTEA
jgi:streptogramin lyase